MIFRFTEIKRRKTQTKTSTFSNVGLVKLPAAMLEHIASGSFCLHTFHAAPLAMTAITIASTLNITFSRSIRQTNIEQYFFSYLASIGFDINITSNYKEVEHAL